MDLLTTASVLSNTTSTAQEVLSSSQRQPLYVLVPVTVILLGALIFSLVGNIVTCIVIVHNRYMHTATNYYLFSLALSDLLLVLTGLPVELYLRWFPAPPYPLGEPFCVARALAAEMSTNASVLTILAFTGERYLAVCRPLLSHTMSRHSRAVRHICCIWLLSLLCAAMPAAHFGIFHDQLDQMTTQVPAAVATSSVSPVEATSTEVSLETLSLTTNVSVHDNRMMLGKCTVVRVIVPNVFALSSVVFFVVPIVLLAVLYTLIAMQLKRADASSELTNTSQSGSRRSRTNTTSRRQIIRMLIAVVVAFFICWAPFHAQRLLAIYVGDRPSPGLVLFGQTLDHVSGVLYFVSTCINPILYQVMSIRFQNALALTRWSCSITPQRRMCLLEAPDIQYMRDLE